MALSISCPVLYLRHIMNDLFFDFKSLATQQVLTDAMAQFPCLDSPEYFLIWLVSNVCWATVSRICVELSRDIFHTLGHVWKQLSPHHLWHHTAYKPGYAKRWPAYYTSIKRHDLPEAVIMTLIAGAFTIGACTQPIMSGSLVGCLFVLMHTLKQLGLTVLRMLKVEWAINTDTMHLTTPLTEPPSIWRVNRAYHKRHHDSDPMAYFGVNFATLDKLMKTALSVKGRYIAFAGPLGNLERPLRHELSRAGGRVLPQDSPIDFNKICILIIDVSALKGICPEAIIAQMEEFLATVQTDEEIITKEIWLIVSDAENAIAWKSLDALYQRYLSDWITQRRLNAPCILRKVIIGHHQGRRSSDAKVARHIVAAVKRDIRNIVVKAPFWAYCLQSVKEWRVSAFFRFNP